MRLTLLIRIACNRGIGREGGPGALNAWLEEKSVIIKVKGLA